MTGCGNCSCHEARLEKHQKVLTRHALLAVRVIEERTELLLVQSIHPLHLLLLAKLIGVVRLLPATRLGRPMLPRRIRAPVHRALLRVALLTLQEQLLTFASAELADRSCISSQRGPLDPALLGRPAPVVRKRRHVLNRSVV